ncbi:MAG TPA: 3-phosphoshikimate 1-carboxyvinyltransferase [Sphingomicrobium sp.]|nr:3-phosphoshikimate 1-carboxyvinyltransferase [Sphingomicrobium sp.]
MKLVATPGGTIAGEATIPGDKSCSHRALILAAMADGESHIRGLLESEDVMATAAALAAFGVAVERLGTCEWRVRGGRWSSPEGVVDCGNSGTAARLLIGAVAGMEGVVATFAGDESLGSRPMRRVTAPLERMGARIEGGDRLPLTVHGARLGGIDFSNVPASAQVKSAILLAGLSTSAPVNVEEPLPSRDHSEIMLGIFGAEVAGGRLGDQRRLTGCKLEIASDPSSAAFPLVAAAIVDASSVTVRNLLVNPLRTGLYETLEAMGAGLLLSNERLQSGEVVADVRLNHRLLEPCHVMPEQIASMIDEIPALAVACAFADGESVIEGLAELKVKESDRLGAVVAGLIACGVAVVADGDALRIFGRGRVRGGAKVFTHGDHRIAMAFLTLGLGAERPVEVDRAEMVATSFPGFVEVMRGIGANIEERA